MERRIVVSPVPPVVPGAVSGWFKETSSVVSSQSPVLRSIPRT